MALPKPGKKVRGSESGTPMNALFGTKAPHLQKKGEADRVIPLEELYLDTGLPEAVVRRRGSCRARVAASAAAATAKSRASASLKVG